MFQHYSHHMFMPLFQCKSFSKQQEPLFTPTCTPAGRLIGKPLLLAPRHQPFAQVLQREVAVMALSFVQLQQHLLELYHFLQALHNLGRESPQALLYLAEIVSPELPASARIPTLGHMFEELPGFFNVPNDAQRVAQVTAWLHEPPTSAVHLRLLLGLYDLATLLAAMSPIQLLHLTNNKVPPGPIDQQRAFLLKLQQVFQARDKDTLSNYHQVLSETPIHNELQQLLELERTLPFELLYVFAELLKLPADELLSFYDWFTVLSDAKVTHLIKLLKVEPNVLMELKKRLVTEQMYLKAHHPVINPAAHLISAPVSASPPSSPQFPIPLPLSHAAPIAMSASLGTSGRIPTQDNVYRLKVARQPPSKTVYQRILKPVPAISLISGNDQGANLFVEVSLVRADNEHELPLALEGSKVARVSSGVFANFKKLKIMSTTQMQGTQFKLRFILKRYVGTAFETIHSATVLSDPIEVYSHTLYINRQESQPSPPVINEILPPQGSSNGGYKTVILGSNFVNTPHLRVRLGDIDVIPTFHEAATLVLVMPPHPPGAMLVKVTNDGQHWCESKVVFSYH